MRTATRNTLPRWLLATRRAAALVVLLVLTTALYLVHWGMAVLDTVASFTGTCPPGPLALPSHPCSVADYVHRMSLGVGLFGTLFEWVLWVGSACAVFYLGVLIGAFLARRRVATRRDVNTVNSWPPPGPARP